MEGFLEKKKSTGFFKGGWQKRYFRLESFQLQYFEKKTELDAKDSVDMRELRDLLVDESDVRCFAVVTLSRRIELRAASADERTLWVEFLAVFRGCLTNPLAPIDIPNPMKVALLATLDFLQNYGRDSRGVFRLAPSNDVLNSFYLQLVSAPPNIPPNTSVDLVATACKKLLRELPETLLTNNLFLHFTGQATGSFPDFRDLNRLVKQLPAANREILHALAEVMFAVVQHQKETQMDAKNLSICIGPNLARKGVVELPQLEPLFQSLIFDKDLIFLTGQRAVDEDEANAQKLLEKSDPSTMGQAEPAIALNKAWGHGLVTPKADQSRHAAPVDVESTEIHTLDSKSIAISPGNAQKRPSVRPLPTPPDSRRNSVTGPGTPKSGAPTHNSHNGQSLPVPSGSSPKGSTQPTISGSTNGPLEAKAANVPSNSLNGASGMNVKGSNEDSMFFPTRSSIVVGTSHEAKTRPRRDSAGPNSPASVNSNDLLGDSDFDASDGLGFSDLEPDSPAANHNAKKQNGLPPKHVPANPTQPSSSSHPPNHPLPNPHPSHPLPMPPLSNPDPSHSHPPRMVVAEERSSPIAVQPVASSLSPAATSPNRARPSPIEVAPSPIISAPQPVSSTSQPARPESKSQPSQKNGPHSPNRVKPKSPVNSLKKVLADIAVDEDLFDPAEFGIDEADDGDVFADDSDFALTDDDEPARPAAQPTDQPTAPLSSVASARPQPIPAPTEPKPEISPSFPHPSPSQPPHTLASVSPTLASIKAADPAASSTPKRSSPVPTLPAAAPVSPTAKNPSISSAPVPAVAVTAPRAPSAPPSPASSLSTPSHRGRHLNPLTPNKNSDHPLIASVPGANAVSAVPPAASLTPQPPPSLHSENTPRGGPKDLDSLTPKSTHRTREVDTDEELFSDDDIDIGSDPRDYHPVPEPVPTALPQQPQEAPVNVKPVVTSDVAPKPSLSSRDSSPSEADSHIQALPTAITTASFAQPLVETFVSPSSSVSSLSRARVSSGDSFKMAAPVAEETEEEEEEVPESSYTASAAASTTPKRSLAATGLSTAHLPSIDATSDLSSAPPRGILKKPVISSAQPIVPQAPVSASQHSDLSQLRLTLSETEERLKAATVALEGAEKQNETLRASKQRLQAEVQRQGEEFSKTSQEWQSRWKQATEGQEQLKRQLVEQQRSNSVLQDQLLQAQLQIQQLHSQLKRSSHEQSAFAQSMAVSIEIDKEKAARIAAEQKLAQSEERFQHSTQLLTSQALSQAEANAKLKEALSSLSQMFKLALGGNEDSPQRLVDICAQASRQLAQSHQRLFAMRAPSKA